MSISGTIRTPHEHVSSPSRLEERHPDTLLALRLTHIVATTSRCSPPFLAAGRAH